MKDGVDPGVTLVTWSGHDVGGTTLEGGRVGA